MKCIILFVTLWWNRNQNLKDKEYRIFLQKIKIMNNIIFYGWNMEEMKKTFKIKKLNVFKKVIISIKLDFKINLKKRVSI